MDKIFRIACGLSLLSGSLSAQTVIVGGAANNGDLELGELAPWGLDPANAAAAATTLADSEVNADDFNHTPGGKHSIEVDLTANNGAGQWKGITEGVDPQNGIIIDYDVEDGTIQTSIWVYIPSATEIGANPLGLDLSFEYTDDSQPEGEDPTWTFAFNLANIANIARDEWVRIQRSDYIPPAGTTRVRTRPWNVTTLDTVNGQVAGPKGGNDATAMPADWIAQGYNGVIFLDDFRVAIKPPLVEESDLVRTVVSQDANNSGFETDELSRFDLTTASIVDDPAPVAERPLGGTKAFQIDLTSNNSGGQWKNISAQNGQITSPIKAGDVVNFSTYAFVPDDVTAEQALFYNFTIRSNNGGPGAGNLNGFNHYQPATDNTFPRGQWNLIRLEPAIAVDGVDAETGAAIPISEINLKGFNLQSVDMVNGMLAGPAGDMPATATPADWMMDGYNGLIYLDNLKMNIVTSPEDVDGVATAIGVGVENGDIETGNLRPWGGNAVTRSTEQNRTPGGDASLRIDLTANNDRSPGGANADAKRILDEGLPIVINSPNDTVKFSAWIYIPDDARFGNIDFGEFGLIEVDLVNQLGGEFSEEFLEFDLLDGGYPRDEWVELTFPDIAVTPETTSIALRGLRFTSNDNVNDFDPGDPELTPADWVASGYNGVFYLDDITLSVTRGEPVVPPADLAVTMVDYTPGPADTIGVFSASYTPADQAIDVYRIKDLDRANLGEPAKTNVTGGTFTVEQAEPKSFYIIVPAGQAP